MKGITGEINLQEDKVPQQTGSLIVSIFSAAVVRSHAFSRKEYHRIIKRLVGDVDS